MNKPVGCDDESRFKLSGEHKHAPDARVLEKGEAMHAMKTMAQATDMSARDIIHESMLKVSNATAAIIAGETQLVQNINRTRQDKDAPKNPKTLDELRFGDKDSKTAKGDEFILYDSYCEIDNDTRTIIFGTKANLKFLAKCPEWFMDGTFKVAPKFFNQLYTIHAE